MLVPVLVAAVVGAAAGVCLGVVLAAVGDLCQASRMVLIRKQTRTGLDSVVQRRPTRSVA